MEIHLLGTGTAVPVKNHSPAGLLVQAAGKNLLLDIGPGTLSRLEGTGITYDKLDALLLSHLHPDHSLDLATLLQAFNYAPGAERTNSFSIYGCWGTQAFLQNLFILYPELVPAGYEISVHQAYRDDFMIGSLNIQTAPTGHTSQSIAFRVEDGQRALVYSGDASRHGELSDLARLADLLVCECSFPDTWDTLDHLNAEDVGVLAAQANVKSLVLTHLYPQALAVDVLAQVRSHYHGELRMAVDGMHLVL
jgi:ribonuclease BN (tRNA processing enzyme)